MGSDVVLADDGADDEAEEECQDVRHRPSSGVWNLLVTDNGQQLRRQGHGVH